MAITFLPIGTISLISIAIIIISIIFSYIKKLMVTYALIIGNFFIFILTVIFPEVIYNLGFRPIYITLEYSPQIYTLFTSMFIHSGFAHIFGNMLVFFFIGMAFEQRVGWKKFLLIYLITGVCGTLTHTFINLGSTIPLVGASGAIFGIMGAFASSYPRDEVVMPIPLGIIMVFRRVKVIYAVLIFAAIETIIVILDVQDTTAHFAHLGGLVSGVIIANVLIKRKIDYVEDKSNYSNVYRMPKIKKINFSNLKNIAKTDELKKIIEKIENENVPQVREIWLDHFFEKSVCPKCSKTLKHFNGKIWCENCDYKSVY
jgi:membrane associated rhomboid family serine protease